MFAVHCVKCKKEYQSPDEDDYYCETCLEEKKAIAADIDKKFANRIVEPVKPRFSQKDFVGKNGRIFFNAKDFV